MSKRYPVAWTDKDGKDMGLSLGELTIGVKNDFCRWLRGYLRADAMAELRGQSDVLNTYLDGLKARVWWVGAKMSAAVYEHLRSPDGGRMYTRLLLGVSTKEMPDDELDRFIDQKEKVVAGEPPSDYLVAIGLIHEDANPKANGPTSGSGRTEM